MPRSDFTSDQQYQLGELDAPIRAERIAESFAQRMRPLMDWGFAVSKTSGGASVSLGALTLITAYCEPEPSNADSVANFIAKRAGPADFQIESVEVQDKSRTGSIALEQLERALETLKTYRAEFAAPDVPMGWAYDP